MCCRVSRGPFQPQLPCDCLKNEHVWFKIGNPDEASHLHWELKCLHSVLLWCTMLLHWDDFMRNWTTTFSLCQSVASKAIILIFISNIRAQLFVEKNLKLGKSIYRNEYSVTFFSVASHYNFFIMWTLGFHCADFSKYHLFFKSS